jgi:hypothetical protein
VNNSIGHKLVAECIGTLTAFLKEQGGAVMPLLIFIMLFSVNQLCVFTAMHDDYHNSLKLRRERVKVELMEVMWNYVYSAFLN